MPRIDLGERTLDPYQKEESFWTPRRIVRYALMTGAGIFALNVLFGSYYTVDQGEKAVVLNNGAFAYDADPGLHMKLPIVQQVHFIQVRTQTMKWEKTQEGDARMQAYSKDQQPAHIAVSVTYHITDAPAVYNLFQTVDNLDQRILVPRTTEQVKNVFGQFTAQEAIQARARLNLEVTQAVTRAMVGTPLVVESVQVQDIEFSPQYEAAVEARMKSIIEQQQAEALKAKRIINADAQLYERQREADAVKAQGLGEAAAIQAKNEALKNSPDIVAYIAASRWNGQLPSTMIPGGALPFLNVK